MDWQNNNKQTKICQLYMTNMCSTYQIWHTDKHNCSGYINWKPIRCLDKLTHIKNSEMALTEKTRMPRTPHGLTCALSCADAMQIWPTCDNSFSIRLTACWSKVMVTSFVLMLVGMAVFRSRSSTLDFIVEVIPENDPWVENPFICSTICERE